MEAVLFVEYPKCSTCKKAKKWLDEHGIPIPIGTLLKTIQAQAS